ncbi:MAG: S41 family peptidase [Chloroflexi bacterium]|nr:S41 family peptidase [Chloroflexota bacterium]
MNQTLWRRIATFALLALVLTIGMGAGMILDRQAFVAYAQSGATVETGAPDFQLIAEAWNTIQRVYVDQTAKKTKPLTYGAIGGMVSALGDTGHSTFLTPEMARAERDYSRGQFEGIGAQVQEKNGRIEIVAPFDNSPAQKAGLKAGDAILKVDGLDVTGLPVEQVISKILGPAGTSVMLTILDSKTGQTIELTLVRARIVVDNVTVTLLPGTKIALLRLSGFSQGVSREVRQALTEIQQQGATAIIFDLRNNPGGLLNEAVGIASQFLASGDVLLEQDGDGKITHVAVRSGGVATAIPMVVLVNNGSASAAEIVAGAIQDARRGTLIGETTFGTGTVLNKFPLSDGSAMMLAVQQWLTPAGRVIWHKGIVPDLVVALTAGASPLTPESASKLTAEQLRATGDQQLLEGLRRLEKTASNPGTDAMSMVASSSTDVEIAASVVALELSQLQAARWI